MENKVEGNKPAVRKMRWIDAWVFLIRRAAIAKYAYGNHGTPQRKFPKNRVNRPKKAFRSYSKQYSHAYVDYTMYRNLARRACETSVAN